jgi:cation transport ATPase
MARKCQDVIEKNKSILGGKLTSQSEEIKHTESEIDRLGIVTDSRTQIKIDKIRDEETEASQKREEAHQSQYDNIQQQITAKESEQNNAQQNLQNVSKDASYGFSKAAYFAILFVIFVGEIPLNFSLFLSLGHNLILTALITVGLSAAMCVLAHYVGIFAKQSVNRWNTIMALVGSHVLVLALFYFTSKMRAGEENIILLGFFGAMNYLLWLAALITSFFFHPKNKEAVQERKRLLRAQRQCRKEIKQLHQQLQKLQLEHEAENKRLSEAHSARIEQAEYDMHPLLGELTYKRDLYESLYNYSAAIENRIVAIYEANIHRFRQANYRHRTSGRPQYWSNPLPPLKLYFQKPIPQKVSPQSKTTPQKNGQANKLAKAGAALLLALSLSLTGCYKSKVNPMKSQKVSVLIDVTESVHYTPAEISAGIIAMLNTDRQLLDPPQKIVEIIVLRDISLTRRYITTWKRSHMLTNPNEKAEKKQAFQHAIDSLILHAISDHNSAYQQSRLYYPICRLLQEIAADTNSEHQVLILSDLLENDVRTFSVYSAQGEQDLKQNPQKIREILKKDCALPDVSNIPITIVHEPQTDTDEWVRISQNIYRELLEEKGAQLTIKANL